MKIIGINSDRWLNSKTIKGEKWRNIETLPDGYSVSNRGRVRKKTKDGQYKILYGVDNGRQYYAVTILHKKYYIHRLVALAFVPNPDGLPEIDHINCNKMDNCPANLQWVTRKMNMANPKTRTKRNAIFSCQNIPVQQLNASGEVTNSWPSIKEAAIAIGVTKNQMARQSRQNGWIGLYKYRRVI